MLGANCKACGGTLRMNVAMPAWGRPVFAEAARTCPACNTVATYASGDCFVLDGASG